LLDLRPPVVDSRIDWSPGADWAVDDRVKWDNGEAAVFPASDTEPPRERLQTDPDPDPSGDNPWAGGMYRDDGTLTLDGSIPATPADSITIESGGTLEIIADGFTAQLNDSPRSLPFAKVATRVRRLLGKLWRRMDAGGQTRLPEFLAFLQAEYSEYVAMDDGTATVADREGNDVARRSSGPVSVELVVPASDAPGNSGGPHGCHTMIFGFPENHGDPACHSVGPVERNTTIIDFNGRDNNCPEVRTFTAGSAKTDSKSPTGTE
jgi:hypothetical protein